MIDGGGRVTTTGTVVKAELKASMFSLATEETAVCSPVSARSEKTRIRGDTWRDSAGNGSRTRHQRAEDLSGNETLETANDLSL